MWLQCNAGKVVLPSPFTHKLKVVDPSIHLHQGGIAHHESSIYHDNKEAKSSLTLSLSLIYYCHSIACMSISYISHIFLIFTSWKGSLNRRSQLKSILVSSLPSAGPSISPLLHAYYYFKFSYYRLFGLIIFSFWLSLILAGKEKHSSFNLWSRHTSD